MNGMTWHMEFKELSLEEEASFKHYAKHNLPTNSDWSAYHPVCRKVWWELACKHDGIHPDSPFIVFSVDNPYFPEPQTKSITSEENNGDYL